MGNIIYLTDLILRKYNEDISARNFSAAQEEDYNNMHPDFASFLDETKNLIDSSPGHWRGIDECDNVISLDERAAEYFEAGFYDFNGSTRYLNHEEADQLFYYGRNFLKNVPERDIFMEVSDLRRKNFEDIHVRSTAFDNSGLILTGYFAVYTLSEEPD